MKIFLSLGHFFRDSLYIVLTNKLTEIRVKSTIIINIFSIKFISNFKKIFKIEFVFRWNGFVGTYVRWCLERPLYDFILKLSPKFVYSIRAKYIFFREIFLHRYWRLIQPRLT